jgi:hypothetical protein
MMEKACAMKLCLDRIDLVIGSFSSYDKRYILHHLSGGQMAIPMTTPPATASISPTLSSPYFARFSLWNKCKCKNFILPHDLARPATNQTARPLVAGIPNVPEICELEI